MRILKRLLAGLLGIAVWGVLAGYLALEGVWMTPVVSSDDTGAFYEWAVGELSSRNKGNSALVLIHNGEVAGQYFAGAQESVDENTLFPTASFSKWITALSVMSLVEEGLLDLDAPISNYLSRWQLPDSGYDNAKVTARKLLSHTAGLTDGLGFGDFNLEETLPSVEDELSNPRASSGKDVEIAVGVEPGSEFRYSGGGYLILQLVIEEVSGLGFVDYVQQEILDPVGMARSTFVSFDKLDNVSSSYYLDGTQAQTYQYASPAATGFASSANDLVKLAQKMLSKTDNFPVKPETRKVMREPHGFVMGFGVWGLGTILYAPSENGDYVFGHDGANDPAINSTVRINPQTSDSIVILVSGHPSLASNIGSQWVLWQTGTPDFLQTEQALESALLPFVIGSLVVLLAIFLWSRRG